MSNTNPKCNLSDVTARGLMSYGNAAESLRDIRKEREGKRISGPNPYMSPSMAAECRQDMAGRKKRGQDCE